jgi:hypothetical protein
LCAFLFSLAFGIYPAFSKPEDKTELLVLHPSVRDFPPSWDPKGRDRITKLREEADRTKRPCIWYHIADLDRVLGDEPQALRDENRAAPIPRVRCPRKYF